MSYQELGDQTVSRGHFTKLLAAGAGVIALQAAGLAVPTVVSAAEPTVYKPGDIIRKIDGVDSSTDSFDDFFGTEEQVEEKLSTLLGLGKEYGVHFNFFPVSPALELVPQLWRRAFEEGHEIGNHTFEHLPLSTLTTDGIRFQILRHWEIAKKILGKEYTQQFLRPPYGDGIFNFDPRIPAVAQEFGLKIAMWSEDAQGWRYYPRTDQEIIDYIVRNSPALPGGIIIQHALITDITAAPKIIEAGLAQGREFKTIGEALGKRLIS